MTVSYQSDVASSSSGGLIKLLWRWRGSVWKLVYRELVIFVIAFTTLALCYRFFFSEQLKRRVEILVIFCSAFVDLIPLSFILGFYVSFTATRWWNQYTAIPWPDKLMNTIAMYVPGNDEKSRMVRRTLMRYLNLTLVLVLRSISISVKRRFPTKEHLVEAGFMTKHELELHSSVPSTEFNTFWIPCTWFISLLREAKQECFVVDSSGLKLIMEEFNEFRSKCGLLWSYDWVSIPLVYTQVVTIATYAFFIASVFGRQAIDHSPKVFNIIIEHRHEPYIPIFSILQFLLYMGLLKLGEQLINPFGDDDEDFELNWIIDRHLKVSFLGVDVLNGKPPPLSKDTYYDDMDIKLPYTAAAVSYKRKTYRGSMATYHVPSEEQGLIVPDFENDDEDADEQESIYNLSDKKSRSNSSRFSSVFGKQFVKKSFSNISLNSANFDSEANESITWKNSSASLVIQEENVLNGKKENGSSDQASQGTLGFKKHDKMESPLSSDTSSLQKYPVESSSIVSALNNRKLSIENGLFRYSHNIANLLQKNKECQALESTSSTYFKPYKSDYTIVQPTNFNSKKTMKLPKPALLKLSKADPKLKIKPYVKSKVTFSDETEWNKNNKNTSSLYRLHECMTCQVNTFGFSNPELNEPLSVYIDKIDSENYKKLLNNHKFFKHIPDTSRLYPTRFVKDRITEYSKCNDFNIRRQSYGGNDECDDNNKSNTISIDKKDNWMRHQSLPNIQEIVEENHSSSSKEDVAEVHFSIKREEKDNANEKTIKQIPRQSEEKQQILKVKLMKMK